MYFFYARVLRIVILHIFNKIDHGGIMTRKQLLILKERFPRLAAEYPREFHSFFNAAGAMTKLGLDVYSMIKNDIRKRQKKRSHESS